MKKEFNIVCRGSWLSLAQVELFCQKVKAHFPDVVLHPVIKETKGDREQSTPLHLVEGKDFFTAEIQENLRNGKADFAVHSMKDVSGDTFFENSFYRIIDRNDIRDVAIFKANILDKLAAGKPIVIGTSSPRRTVMATGFLQKALPQLSQYPVQVEAIPIRGNVDGRLRKLSDLEDYDGIILAAAGLNRLLQYEPASKTLQELLANKRIMFLPLFECAPAAGQGAIVVETNQDNQEAIAILNKMASLEHTNAVQEERLFASKYGYGCSRPFGVFHMELSHCSFTYASGLDQQMQPFTEWKQPISLSPASIEIFSGTDHMRSFYTDTSLDDVKIPSTATAIFVASQKAIHSNALIKQCQRKKVWAAGTRTWFALAKKGIWVEGSADGLGLESILPLFESPMVQLEKSQCCILTNQNSVVGWLSEGWHASATYCLHPNFDTKLKASIEKADLVFWSSYQQFLVGSSYVKQGAIHACPSGKTANRLLGLGLNPLIFPTIKAFQSWRQNIPVTEGA
jgi:hydroxymethylbilane synthase